MKKIFIAFLSFATIVSFSLSSISAISIADKSTLQDKNLNHENVVLQNQVQYEDEGINPEYIDENGNYYNPETGEYFRWIKTTTRGMETAYDFTFEIQSRVSSGYFKLLSANARIDMIYADFVYTSGTEASCCNSHKYTVNLRRSGLSNNIATFYAPHGTWVWDLGDGFSTSASYKVEIENYDALASDSMRLRGAGTIKSYWF